MKRLMGKKLVFVLLFISLSIFLLTACSSKPPKEQIIINDLNNSDLVSRKIDGEDQVLHVKNFYIDKRQTNDKSDEVYCSLEIWNDYYEITGEYVLNYNYYDNGGWILDTYNLVGREKITPLVGVTEKKLNDTILKMYDSFEVIDHKWNELLGFDEYKIRAKKTYKYMTSEDICNIEFRLDKETLQWEESLQVLENSETWDLNGKWEYNYKKEHWDGAFITINFSLIIDSFEGKSIYGLINSFEGSYIYNFSERTGDNTEKKSGTINITKPDSLAVIGKVRCDYMFRLKEKTNTVAYVMIDKDNGIQICRDYLDWDLDELKDYKINNVNRVQ